MGKGIGSINPTMGTEYDCPGDHEGCKGTYIKTSWNKVRCAVCSLEEKKMRTRAWNRMKRERREEPPYEKMQFEAHDCWRCGKITKNYALCDGCHYEGEGFIEIENVGGLEMNKKLDKLYKELKKTLGREVVRYSCKDMTQEELRALVPSAVNVEKQNHG